MADSTRRKFLKTAAAFAGSTAVAGLAGCGTRGGKSPGTKDALLHPLCGIRRENIKITDIKVTLLSYQLNPEELWADGMRTVSLADFFGYYRGIYRCRNRCIGGSSRYNGPEEMKEYTERLSDHFF
jgi:hypothetical protein